jgi:hypothetical protein
MLNYRALSSTRSIATFWLTSLHHAHCNASLSVLPGLVQESSRTGVSEIGEFSRQVDYLTSAKWVVQRFHIRDVRGSNLSPETGYAH